MSKQPLAGRVVVVTGGGILVGRAHAEYLAALGADVVVKDLDVSVTGEPESSAAEEVVAGIAAAGGRGVATPTTSRRPTAPRRSSSGPSTRSAGSTRSSTTPARSATAGSPS